MNNRVDKTTLLNILARWDRFIKRKVRIIACGGTALTLLNVKESTKDIDLLIPNPNEYKYLLATLVNDCLALIREKSSEINIEKLKLRFYETSSYDISDERNRKNFKSFYEALMTERNQNG